MKKILSFLTILCLVFCVSVPAFSAAPQAQTNDESFQFRRLIVDERDADGNLHKPYWVDEDGNEVTVPMPEGHVAAAANKYPASYDLRDFGYVTPVKNQAQVGSCWAFSTIACIESSMLRQGYGTASDTDYSEAHLAWFSQRQRTPDTSDPTHGDGYDAENPFDDGSNLFFSTATLMRGSGVQLESNAPWTNPQSGEDAMRDMAQPESDRYVSYGRLYEARWLYDFTINDVKQALMQNGNVSMAYLHVPYGWNDAHNCYYQNLTDVYVNHGVEIVGWDDNFSKDNFNEGMRPEADGAWLVKGSWGTEYGNDGYYWLSYRDPSISQIFTLVAKPADTYDNIYQYDGTLALASCTSLYGHIQAANRFRSTKTEQLTHVAFWSENYWGVDATVRVYIANEDYVPDGSDPTANMTLVDAATTVLRDVQCGYYTVELKQPVNVSGRYFTVAVSFVDDLPYHSPWTGATITLEGSGESVTGLDFDLSYSGKAGQSFIRNGSEWKDCKEYGNGGFNNVPIKAMTRNKPSGSGFTLTYNANGGSGAPAVQKGVGALTLSDKQPTRAGYIFLGWAENALSKQAQYAPGASFTLTKNVMLYAVWQVDPAAPKTKVSIRNFVPSRTERFFTTVEFFAETENIPGDAHIDWYVNGEKALSDADHFAYYGAKRDYTVQVKMVQGNRVLAQSDVETVHIPRGFSDILRSLFRLLFARPYYVQQ